MARTDIPPLHLIVGFEAAARLRSFKDAASELGVTPSAVSQRVARLEEHLGIRLFERIVRGVELTPAGRRYLDAIHIILDQLSAAGRTLTGPGQRRFSLAMNSIVAQEMVIPNLALVRDHGFTGEIEIVSCVSMKPFAPNDADAGIRIGIGPWPGFEQRAVGPLWTIPLCAPSLAAKVRDWDDFFAHTLYCAKTRSSEMLEAWRHPANGSCHPDVAAFQTLPEAIRATEAGLGVIAGLMPLMNGIVQQRRLQIAFPVERPLPESLLFIHRNRHADGPSIECVFRWLVECYGRLAQSGRGLAPAAV